MSEPYIMTATPGPIERTGNDIVTPKGSKTVPPVALLTAGPRTWASCRFRAAWLQDAAPDLFRWYAPDDELALSGFKVLVFQKRWSKEDIVLAQRAQERGIKIVFDLTDPQWWFDPEPVNLMMRLADSVTVSSEGLEEAVRQIRGVKHVTHIPDRMLPSYHPTVVVHGPRDVVNLVWFGIASNRAALVGAWPILAYVANMGHKFRLRIIDDQPTNRMEGPGAFEVQHIAWTLETFHAQLTACDIAVLPPYPGPWGALKSNNKRVTAGWCGLPVVDGYDPEQLVSLIDGVNSISARQIAGEEGRAIAERDYNISRSVKQWRQLLAELGIEWRGREVPDDALD